jgi:hypothetical protein
MGGASFYFLKPYFQNNTAAVTATNPGTETSVVTLDSFEWSFNPAGAVWLGWSRPDGLGMRARYFFFEQDSSTLNLTNSITAPPQTQTTINPPLGNFLPLSTGGTAFGSPGTVLNSGIGTDQLTFGSSLKIQAIDLEVTYAWRGNGWSLLASGGGRFLTLDQSYHASLVNNGGGEPVFEQQNLDSTRDFTGGGLVGSLFGNVSLGKTGLSLFSSARGSLLVGTIEERNSLTQFVDDPNGLVPPGIPGTFLLTPVATRNSDSVLSTLELELGVQYDVQFAGSDLFFRAAAVNQTYFDAGNASLANGNLSLFGVQFSAGLRY